MSRDLSAEIAREFLIYEPKTGKLFWRERARKWFYSDRQFKIWNTRFAEKEAFFSVHTGGGIGWGRSLVGGILPIGSSGSSRLASGRLI